MNKWEKKIVNQNIPPICKMCSKSIKTEAVFNKTEIDNEVDINFLQNSPLGIQPID